MSEIDAVDPPEEIEFTKPAPPVEFEFEGEVDVELTPPVPLIDMNDDPLSEELPPTEDPPLDDARAIETVDGLLDDAPPVADVPPDVAWE